MKMKKIKERLYNETLTVSIIALILGLITGGILIFLIGENPFDASYRVPLSHVAALATFSTETIRGRFGFLFIAVVMIVITAIDIKYPLFFFHLRHWLTVRDPEPSEFYLFMQRLSWFITPVIAIILMILAVNWWHFA